MREAYHEQLDALFDDLAAMVGQLQQQTRRATQALMEGDPVIAEEVISADEAIDQAYVAVEAKAFELLSLQQPVAGDLRTVVAALRMVAELERMGDLAVHIAKIARLRVPDVAVPEEARPTMERMAVVAEQMVTRLATIISERDVEAVAVLAEADQEMDRLRRANFTELLGDNWTHGVEAAVDIALLGRYYERIADHAESIANRVVYVVTGQKVAAD